MAKENKNKGNVPNLRFPGFEGEWEMKRLGEIATNKSEKYNPAHETNSIKCIEMEHLTTDAGQLLGYIDGSTTGSIKNVFNEGDVLFGKLRPYLKKYLQAPFDGVCSSEIWVLKGKNISNDFLYRIVQSKSFIDLANQSSGSKMPRADWNVVESGFFSVPTLPEQRKISSFLALLDSRIATQNKIIEELESLIKGLCQNLFKENNNANWSRFYLKNLLSERKEFNLANHPIHSVSVSKGVINQIEYLGRSFAAKNTSNYNVVHYGDIIYTKSPTGEFPYGIIKQSFINDKVAVSPLYGVYKPKDIHLANILHYYFSNPVNTNNYLHSLVQKGAKNTINITNQNFLNKEIYLPSGKDEIKTISLLFNSITAKINAEKSMLDKLFVQKKYLLQNLFI